MKRLREILTGVKEWGAVSPETAVTSLTTDSRDAGPGALFFAVRGHRADGHAFAESALQRGAAAVVVDRPDMARHLSRSILVGNSRLALALAAARWHESPSTRLSLVGVTGTNGKTTSTHLLHHVWRRLGLVPGLVGTVAYHIAEERRESRLTTPGPLELQALLAEMVSRGVTHAAMEVSSIALDQDRVAGTRFSVALFTNLTLDHLDYHGTLEAYFEAKRRLFRDLDPRAAVVNLDDAAGERLFRETSAPEKLGFSVSGKTADFTIEEASFTADGLFARGRSPSGVFRIEAPLLGRHNLANCLGVVASCHALGIPARDAALALSDSKGAPGRLERVELGEGRPRVFVDYAHSPDALESVLGILTEIRNGQGRGRLITVFGCGGDRDRAKRPHMARAVSSWSDVTVATSDNPRTEDPEAILDELEAGIRRERTRYVRRASRREAINEALALASEDDIVLIAGKGHETYQIIGDRKLPFDDRAVVREYFGL